MGGRIADYMELQYVLIHDKEDPNHGDPLVFDRSEVVEIIRDLIYPCYKIGLNPLPRLRKVFDQFDWQYRDLWNERDALEAVGKVKHEDRREDLDKLVKNTILNSDFFWFVLGENCRLITARRKDKSTAAFRICGEKNEDYPDVEEVLAMGAKICKPKPETADDRDEEVVRPIPKKEKEEKDPRGEIDLKLALM